MKFIHIEDIDLIMVSMEYSLATIGGFCVGTSYIVEHQRLSGLGYCFSASLPPLLAKCAIKALNIIEANTNIISNLRDNCLIMHEALSASEILRTHFHFYANPLSPLKYIALKNASYLSYSQQVDVLNLLVEYCVVRGTVITVASYLVHKERSIENASIRITVNALLNHCEIQNFVHLLEEASKHIFV